MNASDLGYNKDLFILPFDHRSSFEAGLLGIRGRQADPGEVEKLSAYKRVIYEGFLEALDQGVPVETAAILVDQKYGEELLADANKRGMTTCTSVEKSGQAEFDFEYGDEFGKRLKDASPKDYDANFVPPACSSLRYHTRGRVPIIHTLQLPDIRLNASVLKLLDSADCQLGTNFQVVRAGVFTHRLHLLFGSGYQKLEHELVAGGMTVVREDFQSPLLVLVSL